MAPGEWGAAGIGRIHVPVSWRPSHAGGGVYSKSNGFEARFARRIRAVAEDSRDSSFLRRCLADSRAPRRTALAARMAGSAALHLPRWSRPREGEDAP